MRNKIPAKIASIFLLGMVLSLTSCKDEDPINTKPVAAFSISSELLILGEAFTPIDLSFDQDGTVASWNWDFGDGSTSTEQSPSYFYENVGQYTISLLVTDNLGLSAYESYSKSISVELPSRRAEFPQILWKYSMSRKGYKGSSVTVDNEGRVFFPLDLKGEAGDNIYAIKDGEKTWSLANAIMGEESKNSMSVSDDGNVVYATAYGNTDDPCALYAYNAADGSLIWTAAEGDVFDSGEQFRYGSITTGKSGTIYIGTTIGNVYAINTDGTLKWKKEPSNKDDIIATVVSDKDENIYFANRDMWAYSYDINGDLRWSININKGNSAGYICSSPAISESKGVIYFSGKGDSDGDNRFVALNMNDGTIVWEKDLSDKCEQGGVTIGADGTLYLGGEGDNYIRAYNPDNGDVIWQYEANGGIQAAAAIDNDGFIYFGDMSGFFHVVDGKTGNSVWKPIDLGGTIESSAAISTDGKVFIAVKKSDDSGEIYCLKTDATSAGDTEWPQFAHDARHTGRSK